MLINEEVSVNKIYTNVDQIPARYIDKTMFQVAIIENDSGIIDLLLPFKPNINYKCKEGYSSLGLSLYKKNIVLAKHLIEYKPILDSGFGTFGSYVNIALELFDSDTALYFISKGCKLDVLGDDGNTPLHILFSNFDKFSGTGEIICDRILSKGVNPNIKNIKQNGRASLREKGLQ